MRNSTVRRALMGIMLTGGLKPANPAETGMVGYKAPVEDYVSNAPHIRLTPQLHQEVAAESAAAFAEDLKVLPVGTPNVDSVKIQQSGPYGKFIDTHGDYHRGGFVVVAETAEKAIKTAISNTLAAGGSKIVRQADLRNVQVRSDKSKAAKKKLKPSPLLKLLIKQVT